MKFFSIGKKLTEQTCDLPDENMLIAMTGGEWSDGAFRNLPHHKKVVEQAAHRSGVYAQLFPDCILGTLLILQKGSQNSAPCPLSFYFTQDKFYFIGSQTVIDRLIHRANKNSLPDNTTARDLLGVFIHLLIDEDNDFFMGLETAK